MKNWNKPVLALTACITAAVIATGCSEDPKAKEHMEQALMKQAEMKAYSFTGNADLNIELPVQKEGANPLTAAMLNMLLKSKLEWKGAAASEPVRFEADIKSTPSGSSTALELPVLLKDNKLFLHIPMLNKADEYYSMDMAELAKLSGQANPVSPDSLKNITKTLADATKLAITDVNPKWFKEKTGAALKDGSKAISYRLDITDKNRTEISNALKAKLPQLADTMKASGLMSQGQADQWKKDGVNLDLKAPGSIAFMVDDAGFIREQNLNLALSYKGVDGKEQTTSFQITQAYNNVNQNPPFTKEVPKNAHPLNEILKLLMPQSVGK